MAATERIAFARAAGVPVGHVPTRQPPARPPRHDPTLTPIASEPELSQRDLSEMCAESLASAARFSSASDDAPSPLSRRLRSLSTGAAGDTYELPRRASHDLSSFHLSRRGSEILKQKDLMATTPRPSQPSPIAVAKRPHKRRVRFRSRLESVTAWRKNWANASSGNLMLDEVAQPSHAQHEPSP